ncbi:hypothetical protein BC828DRAFT_382675 [Blastocladiella britannica]|nr:hypothetical protein BC828DRAFT_382675 [Blastocladiella britannica]
MPMMVPPPLSMPGIAPPTPLTMAVPSEPHWCPPAMSLMYPIHPPFLPPSVWMFDPARNCFILMHLTAVAPIPKSPEFGGLLTAGPIGCETICPPPTHSDMMFYPSLPATPFVGEYPAAHRGLIQADPYAHGDEAISRSNKQGTCVRLDSPGGSYSGVQQELTDVPPSLAHIVAVTAWPMPRPEIMAAIFPGAVAREFYSPASKGAIVSRLLVFATVDVAMSACAAYPEIVSPWHVHVAPKRDGLAPLRSKQANRMQ